MQYYLKDLGHGFGTFIKILDWTEIKNNFLLSIGENYIVFTLGVEEDMLINEHTSNKEDEEYNDLINLKIFSLIVMLLLMIICYLDFIVL